MRMVLTGNGMFKQADPVGDFVKGIIGLNPPDKGPLDVANEAVFSPLANYLIDKLERFGHLLNENSAEIITFGVVGCAFMMMITSVVGQSSRWFGWMVLIMIGGIIWRIVI